MVGYKLATMFTGPCLCTLLPTHSTSYLKGKNIYTTICTETEHNLWKWSQNSAINEQWQIILNMYYLQLPLTYIYMEVIISMQQSSSSEAGSSSASQEIPCLLFDPRFITVFTTYHWYLS
jgi:hypothetical protein